MQLEKILEEIDQKIAKVRSIPISEDEFAADGEEIYYNGKTQGRYEELIWCRNIILKHMNDGWIPVEERLPEGRTRVICQFDNGDIELLWQDWESDPESLTYWTDFDFMAEKKVIAWRPLPDPYRPERSTE